VLLRQFRHGYTQGAHTLFKLYVVLGQFRTHVFIYKLKFIIHDRQLVALEQLLQGLLHNAHSVVLF
jgi:hypothetical protein